MWDPKPDAPAEYRGEFGVKPTNVPGIILSDMLPMCGRIMDKWSIVRSLHHDDAGHSTGDQICFTGYPSRPESRRERPSELRLDRGQAAGPSDPATAGLRDDSADGAGHRPGLSRRGLQAVRDAGRPGQARPVPGAELQPAGGRDPGARRRSPAAADAASTRCAATWTSTGQMEGARPLPAEGLGHPHLAGGARRLRPRPRADPGPRALRLHAGVRSQGRRTAAAPRPGASASCWPGGWSRPACAW